MLCVDSVLLVKNKIKLSDLKKIAEERYGDLVKAVVDIRLNMIAVGGEMHSDEMEFLLEQGSKQEDLWGINIYPEKPQSGWIEFDSVINIRPRQNNRSRTVEDSALQEKIKEVVNILIKE